MRGSLGETMGEIKESLDDKREIRGNKVSIRGWNILDIHSQGPAKCPGLWPGLRSHILGLARNSNEKCGPGTFSLIFGPTMIQNH